MSKRPSLKAFAPQGTPPTEESKVVSFTEKAAEASRTYPKISVYLSKEEIRTLKLVAIDSNRKVSDILAEAVRDWMKANGHARSTQRTA